MSKQRRVEEGPAAHDPARGGRVGEGDLSAELQDALAVGNQAAAGQLGRTEPIAVDPDGASVAAAERAATALRVAPRDAALTGRLVDLVRRSDLPEHRRAVIELRLVGDQSVADQVADAVTRRLGRDDPALRSELIAALDRAPAGDERGAELAARVGRAVGAEAPAVHGLLQDLTTLLAVVFDDEEEELAPPGDYAAEESGS